MTRRVLVRGARQLVTLRGPSGPRRGPAMRDLGIVGDGALLIEDGVITHVGPSRRIENLAEARRAEEIDASGRVVLPGFVDSHTHLIYGPPRLTDYAMRLDGADYEEIGRAGGGILASVRAVRAWTARRLESQALEGLALMARAGTTTVEVKSGYGLSESAELKMLRVARAIDGKPLSVAPTVLGAHSVAPEYAGRPDEYVKWVCAELLPKVAARGLARFADVYCDRNAFNLEQTRMYLEAAAKLKLGLKIHAGQFSELGGVRLALELGAISADHLEAIGDAEIALLSASQTIGVLLPGSVFHLGLTRYAPARKLIDAGAAVALATDFNPGTSPTPSMPLILSLACAQMRMSPAEAIAAATINGAWALGIAHSCGSLEAGKQADLTVMAASDYREIPYYFGAELVRLTMKRGRVVYTRGEVACPED
jgi:imidazolonepropionase